MHLSPLVLYFFFSLPSADDEITRIHYARDTPLVRISGLIVQEGGKDETSYQSCQGFRQQDNHTS